MRRFDVVILGAGPAGATTALALRKSHPHLSVVMIEACDFQTIRPGEILSSDAVPIMQQLDVLNFFMEQNHPQVPIETAHCSNSAGAPDFPGGISNNGGWHLDRARFDGMLAGYAAASGVSFIRATMTEAHFLADGSWQLVAQSSLTSHTLSAAFVVDATGRSARFATEIGVPQMAHDTLVGVVRVIGSEYAGQADYGTLIEPFEHGWWYSAPTADRRLAVVAMTDADISKRLQLTHIAQWAEHLQASPLTRERVANLKIKGDLSVCAAHTRNLSNCFGKNWLAVGDAAASVDPISSYGILRALRFGIHASDAIGGHFRRQESSLENYEALVQAEFENNTNLCSETYRSESRWKNAPFWQRRQAAPSRWQERKSPLPISNGTSLSGSNLAKYSVALRAQ